MVENRECRREKRKIEEIIAVIFQKIDEKHEIRFNNHKPISHRTHTYKQDQTKAHHTQIAKN